ncbi:MAG: aminoglycoside phosphotransferase family protein [Candidatus Promineifilaceae bacterium]|nr:aminoglycoside phosphotransferase family protein [Candidatus Promineifilaceae bacterium]
MGSLAEADLSPAFSDFIIRVHQEQGRAWLAALPALIRACAERWSLSVGSPFPELTYNFVAPAQRAGTGGMVLKIGPLVDELAHEIAALAHYDGRGAARLLAAEPAWGALLLERLGPATPLREVSDDQATLAAAQVMEALWRPPPESDEGERAFPSTADWAAAFEHLRKRYQGGTGPLPTDLVQRAHELFEALLTDAAPAVLLHGDLHHDNILAAERAPWLAIDPKGVFGEPAYEVGALVRNPIDRISLHSNLRPLLNRRLDLLSERLGLDRQRLWGWSLAQAMLAAVWSLEEADVGWNSWLSVARTLTEPND